MTDELEKSLHAILTQLSTEWIYSGEPMSVSTFTTCKAVEYILSDKSLLQGLQSFIEAKERSNE